MKFYLLCFSECKLEELVRQVCEVTAVHVNYRVDTKELFGILRKLYVSR